MKSLMSAVAVAVLLAAPVASFAQSSQQPVTRAQVRAELVQLEKAGYNPAVSDGADYPTQLQAAEARVAAQNGTAVAQAETTGYGTAGAGSSRAGAPVPADNLKPVYFGN